MKRMIISIMAAGLLLAFPSLAAASHSPGIRYVALGDSVAAGVGLPAPGQTADDQRCGRTAWAYPHQLARSLGTTVTNLACSGAKVNEGFRAEPEDNSVLGAQIGPAFANGTPQLITVTAGANDVRWASAIRDCYTWRCGSEFDDFRFRQLYLPDLAYELDWMLSEIQSRSNGTPPKVLVNGYYAPFANAQCSDARGVTAQEVAWLSSRTNELNRTISDAVRGYSFAEYVPVNFSGYELCSADPWIQGRSAAQRFHPTIDGQTAIAEANLRAYRR